MLQGDLATMSLADVLQWADAISNSGVLRLERGSVGFWFRIEARHVVRVQRADALGVSQAAPASSNTGDGIQMLSPQLLAREQLYDQFLDSGERFRFDPEASVSDDGLPLRLSLQKLVMEGLRILDEWPRLRAAYPADQARLQATGVVAKRRDDSSDDGLEDVLDDAGEPEPLSVIQAAVLTCAQRALTLSQARLVLGLSRPALLRAVDDLRALGCVEVEAAPSGIDLMTQLVDQASALIHARQFEEAQHVLHALLASDPSSVRVKRLLRESEVMHVQALYMELPREAVVRTAGHLPDATTTLTSAEDDLLDRVNDRWDVATLVLVSPQRELETLKALRRLWRQGLIELHRS